MKDSGTRTLLIVALVAVGGVLLWLYARGKKAQGSSSGGVFGTIGAGWNAASGLTQNVTEKSVQTAETLGGGVKDGANGVIDIADKAAHVGGKLNPANWW